MRRDDARDVDVATDTIDSSSFTDPNGFGDLGIFVTPVPALLDFSIHSATEPLVS